ncbi:MAG: M23 family metallopeptidase [Zymomonas mobilis]|uniref:Peptidase M23-like protein n=1 Tax=Zymomonas mobilis TaxID=542 RepID=A0A542W2B5_ZYMMB|nr:M23 family metallopeptidase [Zymomonas mobilis]TQL17734.1 peptidase M23-like protein [Zymomonas mobilis]
MIAKDSIQNRATNVVAQDKQGMKFEHNRLWLKISLLAVMISTPALASKHHSSSKSSASHSSSHAVTLHQKKSAAFHSVSSHSYSSGKVGHSKSGHFSLAHYQGSRYGSHYAMSRSASHFAVAHRSFYHGFQPISIDPSPEMVNASHDEPVNRDNQYHKLFVSWAKADAAETEKSAVVPSATPLNSRFLLTSPFGVRSDPFRRHSAMHAGVDLAAPYGTPVYASADGVVDRAGGASGYGNLVEIDHGHMIQTRYGHLSRIMVHEGQAIKRGDLIALMGSTGRSTGSHLHYEVRIQGEAVNPVPFLAVDSYHMAMLDNVSAGAQGGPEKDIKDVRVQHNK